MRSALRHAATRHPVAVFLGLTFLLTWGTVAWVAAGQAGWLGHRPSILWLALLGQFGPLWAAVILVGAASGRPGLRTLLRSVTAFRMGWTPFLAALLLPPLQAGLAVAAYALAGSEPLDVSKVRPLEILVGFLVGTLIGLIFGGLTEEVGWRGVLLPRLQRRLHPGLAGAVVGAIWALWHLEPEILASLFTGGPGAFWTAWAPYQARYLTETVPFAVLMAALFNRARGNLLSMMLIHAASNALVAGFWAALKPLPPLLRHLDLALAWILAAAALWAWRSSPRVTEVPGLPPDAEAGAGPQPGGDPAA